MHLPWRTPQSNKAAVAHGSDPSWEIAQPPTDIAAEIETHMRIMNAGAHFVDLSRKAGYETAGRSPWLLLFGEIAASRSEYVFVGIVQEDRANVGPHGAINRYNFLMYTVKRIMVPGLVEDLSITPDGAAEPESTRTYDNQEDGMPLFDTPATIIGHPRWFELRQRRARQDELLAINQRHKALRYAVDIFDLAAMNLRDNEHVAPVYDPIPPEKMP